MGQYKFMCSFVKGFKIGFDYQHGWEANLYLGLFHVFIGLTSGAKGYNMFNKWFGK